MVAGRRTSALLVVVAAASTLAGCTSGAPDYTPPPLSPTRTTPSSTAPSVPAPAFGDPDVVSDVLDAAERAVVAINTYSYKSVAKDFDAAKKRTTGAYRNRLDNAFGSVLQQVRKTKTVQQATVDHTGLIQLGPKRVKADVLVGGTLRTAREDVDPRSQRFTTVVTMSKTDGEWLASEQKAPDGLAARVPGNGALHDAFAAAKAHLPALYTFRHAHFDEDYDTLLKYTTGDAHDALKSRRDAIQSQLQNQQTDLTGTLRALSVVAANGHDGGQVEVFALVEARTRFEGVQGASRRWQLDAMLTRSGDHWLISDFTAAQVT